LLAGNSTQDYNLAYFGKVFAVFGLLIVGQPLRGAAGIPADCRQRRA
jgi:hypothetical protein